MRAIVVVLLLVSTTAFCWGEEKSAHTNELAFGLGGFPTVTRSDAPRLELGPGIAWQVNYGRRILDRQRFALYGEAHFLASPQRIVSSSFATATRDVASLYVTPGVRLKLLPGSRVSPYFAIGGGYGEYEQSKVQIDGQPNAAPRELSRGVFDVGAGADFRLWRWIALRAEARDFLSGAPAYNTASVSGSQHNVVAGAALVFRWH